MTDELWAIGSNNQIFTENGILVGNFILENDAKEIVEDHNIGVELNRPDPPEVIKSQEEKRSERLKQWKEIDPTGYRLFELVISAAQRGMNFLSLKAPEFLIAQQLQQMQERILTLQKLHPMPEGFEDVE